MGLDMYLQGKKWLGAEKRPLEDGFEVSEVTLELGYWRKHPNLHGYIVKTFAKGIDECQDIPLGVDDLRKILDATERDQLPHTEGFFFGESRPEDKAHTIEIMKDAIEWATTEDRKTLRSVIYHASW